MNIFYLDPDPSRAAAAHCDQHVCKMVVETAQLLCTAHHVLGSPLDLNTLYRPTHVSHPCAVWVRQCAAHYDWTVRLLVGLSREYARRYDRQHKTARELLPALMLRPHGLSVRVFEAPPQAMDAAYRRADTVEAYRAYYAGEKLRFARWRHGARPEWLA